MRFIINKTTIVFLTIVIFFIGCSKKLERNNPYDPGGGNYQGSNITTGIIKGKAILSGTSDYSGVTISLTGTNFTTTTASTGDYTIDKVNPGTYTISATKTGYSTVTKSGITVIAGQTTNVEQLTLTASSSGGGGSGGGSGGSTPIGTTITSDITTNTTWTTSGSPYIIQGTGSLFIRYIKANLTINPGVVVKVEPYVIISFNSNGGLNAVGTASNPITFTVNNGYSNVYYIMLTESTQYVYTIQYCKFDGITLYNNHVNSDAVATIDHCKFINNTSNYYKLGFLNYYKISISYCTFDSNTYGIYQIGPESGASKTLTVTYSVFTNNGDGTGDTGAIKTKDNGSNLAGSYCNILAVPSSSNNPWCIYKEGVDATSTASMTYSWWGTVDGGVVNTKIRGTASHNFEQISEISSIGCGF